MNFYLILSSVALFVNLFVWIYVFAQQKRDPVNTTFLWFAAGNIGWICCDIMLYLPAFYTHANAISKLCSLFWIPCGFWFLLFAYALLNKPKDHILTAAGIVAAMGFAITVSTDSILVGNLQFDWGIAPLFHPVFHPMIALITATTSVYAVVLISKKRNRSEDILEKRALNLLIVGASLAMIFIASINVILPSAFGYHKYPMLGSCAFTIFVVMVFLAVTKYRFLSISVEKVAEELFEDIHEGILLADRSGRIQRSNLSARKIFGKTLEGRDLYSLFKDSKLRDDFSNRIIKFSAPDKSIKHYAVSLSTVKRTSEILGKILLVRDISEQIQAELVLRRSKAELEREVEERTKQLKHAQRMEAVGSLAGGIAHDFNNILAVILGFANAARYDTPRDNPIYEDLKEIITAGNRGREIVRQMLTISRKSDSSEFVPVDINIVVKETLDLLKVSMPADVTLKVRLHEAPSVVQCDATQIAQVLMNLCNNALYAMKDLSEGELGVSVGYIDSDDNIGLKLPDVLKPGHYVRIVVSDTGSGIDEATLSKIFTPFFTTKPKGEGTGLGLATAFVIIQNHDGIIDVLSEKGRGTSFSIYLPLVEEGGFVVHNIASRDSDPPAFAAEYSERILFVDDEPQVRRMGRRVLEQMGYSVVTADSGRDALQKLDDEKNVFDLVITDYNMPMMTGITLAENITRLKNNLPVIIMSGFADRISQEDMDAAAIKAFLQKPVHKKTLNATIRKVIDGERNTGF